MSSKTSGLAAAGAIASTDLLMMVDVSDTSMAATGTNKKPTVGEMTTAITTIGALATVAMIDDLSGVTDASTARTNLGVDYTTLDERARDAIGTAIVAGAGITKTVNDGADTITIGGVDPLSTVASSSTAQTINVASYGVIDLTLTAACALTMSGASAGSAWTATLILRQDSTGSRLVTWPSGTIWASGSAPTLSTAANAIDVVTLVSVDGGMAWLGFLGGKAFA